jgi:hypothetical protein
MWQQAHHMSEHRYVTHHLIAKMTEMHWLPNKQLSLNVVFSIQDPWANLVCMHLVCKYSKLLLPIIKEAEIFLQPAKFQRKSSIPMKLLKKKIKLWCTYVLPRGSSTSHHQQQHCSILLHYSHYSDNNQLQKISVILVTALPYIQPSIMTSTVELQVKQKVHFCDYEAEKENM